MGRFQKRAAINVVLVLVGYGALIGLLLLAIQHHFDTETDNISMVVVVLFFFPLLIVSGTVSILRARSYDVACLPDAMPSGQQPDLALALQSGESLALIKKAKKGMVFFVGIWIVLLSAFIINAAYSSVLDHPVLIILLACFVPLGIITGILGGAQAWQQTISANDDGVTVKYAILPQRRMAWEDIQATVCTASPYPTVHGGETLFAERS